ncbi:MAG: ArnT family glycosyltransferase [Gaiellaceae bacterium]
MRYRVATGVIAGGVLLLLLWDVAHFNWVRSYDAAGSAAYNHILVSRHALPVNSADTSVWHNPPLFFVLAVLLEAAVGWVVPEPQRVTQLFDLGCGLGLLAIAYFATRELMPRSRLAPVVALAFTGFAPIFVRVSIMYHPEPLATLLAMSSAFVLLRAHRRGALGPRAVVFAGALAGLGMLTRSWAVATTAGLLAVLALDALWQRDRRAAGLAGLFAAVAFAVSLPWWVREVATYGHPFPFNLAVPHKPVYEDQPLRFYAGLGLPDSLTHPIDPSYRNELIPTMYTDWWGDYIRDFDVPIAQYPMSTAPPPSAVQDRAVQSFVGLLPTLLMLAGTAAFAVRGIRRRDAPALLLPGALGALAVAFLYFAVSHPRHDVETLKAVYVLDALVPLAVGAAFAVDRIVAARRRLGVALLVVLSLLALVELRFLVLTHHVT